MRTEEVDGEVAVDPSAIAKIIMKVHAGVVDQDVETFDALGSSLNLRRVGHIQGQEHHALIRMCKGLARTGIHALRASLPTEAAAITDEKLEQLVDQLANLKGV